MAGTNARSRRPATNKKQIKDATGKSITELKIDLASQSGGLSGNDLDNMSGGTESMEEGTGDRNIHLQLVSALQMLLESMDKGTEGKKITLNKKITLKLTSDQRKRFMDATGKSVTALTIDLGSAAGLTETR